MWIWIIIIAVAISGLFGYLNSENGEDAAGGAMAGGCMAIGCLGRLAFAALSIIIVLWLFKAIFG